VVSYRAVCADPRQRLVYEARISGSSNGSLTFEAVATPETDFITNRAGFVVLHPAALAGQRLKVSHVDGRESDARFPRVISPSQPVFDIRALSHEVASGLWATCRMKGDAFEMEDQRNWTDASYKTYVRPLALPWGYTLAKGSRHDQSVQLSFDGRLEGRGEEKGSDVRIKLGRNLTAKMPDLGVALAAEEASAVLAASDALRTLNPHFLVSNVDARDGRGLAEVQAYRQVAEAISAGLVLEIVIPDERDAAASLAPVAEAVRRAGLMLESIVVSSAADLKSWQPGAKRPEKPTVEEICIAARAAFPGVKLGGGTLSTFTELNRKRPKGELFDYVTHTTCSIVHELLCDGDARNAAGHHRLDQIGDKAHRIGPSAVAARSNPYGKGLADNPRNERVCLTDRDPRQRGLFNAAWALGYVAACALGGVEAVAIGAATGPLGFIYRHAGYPRPYFDSIWGVPRLPRFSRDGGARPRSRTPAGRGAGLAARERRRSGMVRRRPHHPLAREPDRRAPKGADRGPRRRGPASERD
jgi:D-apionolactonase